MRHVKTQKKQKRYALYQMEHRGNVQKPIVLMSPPPTSRQHPANF